MYYLFIKLFKKECVTTKTQFSITSESVSGPCFFNSTFID